MWKTSDEKAIKFLNRAVLLDLEIEEIKLFGTSSAYLVKQAIDEHILYIPNDIKHIVTVNQPLSDIKGTLRVIGGDSISTFGSIFSKIRIDVLDLTKLSTKNCTSMKCMFAHSRIKQFIFGKNWDTSNVKDMSGMFSNLNINLFKLDEEYTTVELDLNSWNMENVEDISNMFFASSFKSLKINKWNLRPGVIATAIFDHMTCIEPLDLRGMCLRKIILAYRESDLNMHIDKYTSIQRILIDKEDYDNRIVRKFVESLKSGAEIVVVDNENKG